MPWIAVIGLALGVPLVIAAMTRRPGQSVSERVPAVTVARTLPALLGVLAIVVVGALLLVGPAEGSTGLATYDRPLAPRLTGWDDPRLQRQNGATDLGFATRATGVVSDAVYHCEPTTQQSLLSPLVAGAQGILDPAYLRCGFCHQVAFVLAETLVRGGIESAYVRGLDGHVVTAFSLEGTDYVADADFGVAPFAVDWDDPDVAPYPIQGAWLRRVEAIYADTSTDDPYSNMDTLRHIAAEQNRLLAAAQLSIAALGLLVILVAYRVRAFSTSRSRRASLPVAR